MRMLILGSYFELSGNENFGLRIGDKTAPAQKGLE
jgi:hypothetical protein